MIVKHRSGWGYETLVRGVFRLAAPAAVLSDRDQRAGAGRVGTVRKRHAPVAGAEVVHEITRELIQKARREKRFRPGQRGSDSTVVEADVKYPTDSGLADAGVERSPARSFTAEVGEKRNAVRDRSRSIGRELRALTRSIRRRSGEAKAEVLKLTGETGTLLKQSIREARKLAATARRRARGGTLVKLEGRQALAQLADRCEKVIEQITKRVNGEKITDRIVSLWDPDARPIRKGKLGKPTEFGYVDQLCEGSTPNTKKGARGFMPPTSQIGTRPRTRYCPTPPAATQPRHQTRRDHRRRRVHDNRDQHHARGPGRHRPHRRPPRTRLQTQPPPPPTLPHRDGRTGQPPQTRLWAAAITPERRRRPPDLGRLATLAYNADTYTTLK